MKSFGQVTKAKRDRASAEIGAKRVGKLITARLFLFFLFLFSLFVCLFVFYACHAAVRVSATKQLNKTTECSQLNMFARDCNITS